MFAVIKTGGKQYLVTPGQRLKVEKLAQKSGDVVFDQVLLLNNDKTTEIGTPVVQGASVQAGVVKEGKAKKVIVFKFKSKKREKTKKGHRQPFTEIEITEITP
jgi:large subunit ribosomal protein L21